MRTIAAVTVARSDYGIFRPILKRIAADPAMSLQIIAAGTHLCPEFGCTVKEIERDGFEVSDRVEMLLSSDSPEGVAKAMGLGAIGFAQTYRRINPDLLLVLGDRFEMHAAVSAAVPFQIPVAHIHGGELTQGAIDDAFRHSITKMSHLHFTAMKEYARRVIQMGEAPWRVHVCGAPGLDNISEVAMLSRSELFSRFDLDLPGPFLLATYHPETVGNGNAAEQIGEVFDALEELGISVLFTCTNADTSGRGLAHSIREFCSRSTWAQVRTNLGTQGYLSAMAAAAAIVGNSSSGIIEAPSFGLPAVNVGSRQCGRVRARNVIDVECFKDAILSGVRRALSPAFKASLAGLENPYGDGRAAERIVAVLGAVPLDRRLVQKEFHDLP